jgi:hypothetical protein
MTTILPAHPEKIISFWQRQLMTVFGQALRPGAAETTGWVGAGRPARGLRLRRIPFCLPRGSSRPIRFIRRDASIGLNLCHNSESGCFSLVELK